MMFKHVAAAMAALCLAGTAAAQESAASGTLSVEQAQALSVEIWETMSVAQARALVAEIGATVSEVEDLDDGNFVMRLADADDMYFELQGTECRGAGEAKTCPEFYMTAWFQAEDAADAVRMAQRVDVVWLNEAVVGEDQLLVTRIVILHGGVTRAHMRELFLVFINTMWVARDQAFPQETSGSGSTPGPIAMG